MPIKKIVKGAKKLASKVSPELALGAAATGMLAPGVTRIVRDKNARKRLEKSGDMEYLKLRDKVTKAYSNYEAAEKATDEYVKASRKRK